MERGGKERGGEGRGGEARELEDSFQDVLASPNNDLHDASSTSDLESSVCRSMALETRCFGFRSSASKPSAKGLTDRALGPVCMQSTNL